MDYDRIQNPFSSEQDIEEALKRLDAKMVYAGMEPMELVSCGVASLNMMGWVSRSTNDVDINLCRQGGRARQGQVGTVEDVAAQFAEVVAEVGHELGI